MAKKLIEEYRTGETVDEVFLLAQNELKATRADKLYLSLTLSDKSGSIPGRMWDATEAIHHAFAVDDFVRVKGKVETYQNELQIVVRSISKPDTSELRLGDFLPQSENDPGKMMKELRGIMDAIQDPDYAAIVKAFLSDEAFVKAFARAPAATANHHAYLGGLLEHTLMMARLAQAMLPLYPKLRPGLLLAGVLLHDIGKTRELSYSRTFQYTDDGMLVGHLMGGVLMLEDKARQIEGFPEEKLSHLKHMILSHHGQYEFGSPKLPATAEALALHYLDNLDAKLKGFVTAVENDPDATSDWTTFIRSFARRLYKK